MKITLISPSSGKWRGLGRKRFFNGKTFRFSMLSLLSVAALTPKKHTVKLIDEQIDEVPFDEDCDLVGITMMTATAPRAYELCDVFRARGIPVVAGGFHVTLNPGEAQNHADSVVLGPAGGAWEQVLNDVERGVLKQRYYGNPECEIPLPLPKHLLKKSAYVSVNTTYATLGCTNNCSFCSVTSFYKGKRYRREIRYIVEELKSFREKFFMFIDDNLTQDRDYILELLNEITALKKKWVTQASIEIADDPELLRAMRRAGCAGVFIGLESFSEAALCSQNKKIKSPLFYKEAIRKIHQQGIFVEAGLIFGFDTDQAVVFSSTLRVLQDIGIDAMQASILTPLPGTVLFEQMRDRIVDSDWEHYDYKHAVFEPVHMTREELMAGLQWINKKFYSPWNILARLIRWLRTPSGFLNARFPLLLNIAYWGRQYKFNVRGYDPVRARSARIPRNRLDAAFQYR